MSPVLKQNTHTSQHGIALVVVLLVISIVAAIVVKVMWRFDLDLSRSSHRLAGIQSRAYQHSIEDAAKILLRYDITGGSGNNSQGGNQGGSNSGSNSSGSGNQNSGTSGNNTAIDSLDDDWAQELTFPTDEGYIKINIKDAHSRFNLNTLSVKAATQKANGSFSQRFSAPQRQFIRLLQAIPMNDDVEQPIYLEEQMATGITEAIIDWMDADNTVTGFGGAESDYYGSLTPPHVIANRPMISVSELLIIQGMTPALYQKLLPFVVALPDTNIVFNINTAPIELVRTINSKDNPQPLSLEDAQLIIDERDVGWDDVNQFTSSSSMESIFPIINGKSDHDSLSLVVASNYFLVFGEIAVGEKIKRTRSLLYRNQTNINVLRRTDAEF